MPSTLAQVIEIAAANKHEVTTYVDSATPAGHFAAISQNALGDKLIYLLEGEKDAPEAKVKGYVLMVFDDTDSLESFAYGVDAHDREKSLGRVRSYSGATESFASVFAQMV